MARRSDTRRRKTEADRRGAPLLIAAPALIGFTFLFVPIIALLIRAPWHGLSRILSDNQGFTALRLSLECATSATIFSLVFGVPVAWVLARVRMPGIALLRACVTLPLVLPPVVGGLALLLALSRFGVAGQYFERWFGLGLFPFDTLGVIIAETFVAMPFLIITVEGALRSSDRELEEAAVTLGASRLGVFFRVTLPLVTPSLLAGTILCWARALGEFGATITFAGNLPGRTQTVPILIYNLFESDPPAATAVSLILLLVAVIVLTALRDRWLRGVARL